MCVEAKIIKEKGVDEMLREILEENFKKFKIDGRVTEIKPSTVVEGCYFVDIEIVGTQYIYSTPFDIPGLQQEFSDLLVRLIDGKVVIALTLVYKVKNIDVLISYYKFITKKKGGDE